MPGVSEGRLHDDEVPVDDALVRRLLRAQLPELADLPLARVDSAGTVNAIYRLLGTDLTVRLPRAERFATEPLKELEWLGVLAPRLTLAVPEAVAHGVPGEGYPFHWAVVRWIEGDVYDPALVASEADVAEALAGFVRGLRAVDVAGVPESGRPALDTVEHVVAKSLREAADLVDADRALQAWGRALEAPAWDGTPTWRHCDLIPPNLLVRDGRLAAVIDFGMAGAGDPAIDVIPAWAVLDAPARAVFRAALEVDDGTWARDRGIALLQAALILPYYRATNSGLVRVAQRTIARVLDDLGL